MNNSGAAIDHLDYDAFGNITNETVPGSGDRYKYAGYQWDASVSLYSVQARWYDPATGRWTSEDPLAFAAGDENLNRYVRNAPTNATDPSGLIGIFFHGFAMKIEGDTTIHKLFDAYAGYKVAYTVPNVTTPSKSKYPNAVNDAYDEVQRALARNRQEPVDVFGWSRGSIFAVLLVRKLSEGKPPAKVRFVGLIDPVITDMPTKGKYRDQFWLPAGKWTAPDAKSYAASVEVTYNVEKVFQGVKDGKVPKGDEFKGLPIFRTFPVSWDETELEKREFTWESERDRIHEQLERRMIYKKYPVSHNDSGWDADIRKDLIEAAKKAGVSFGKVED